MADPLSVTASVVGLLAVAGKMSNMLYSLVGKAKEAPSLANSVLMEMSDITAAVGQLQKFINGHARIDAARGSLILVEHVLTTLTGCVTTYSELESILDGLNIDSGMGTFDRVVWSLKESSIRGIVQRLQNHKISLTLMLNILQW